MKNRKLEMIINEKTSPVNKVEIFISYSHEKGFGNSVMLIDKEPNSFQDLRRIKETLEKHSNFKQIIIIFWKVLKHDNR